MPDDPNRLTRAWVCLRCKPFLEFPSREEWKSHYFCFHSELVKPEEKENDRIKNN